MRMTYVFIITPLSFKKCCCLTAFDKTLVASIRLFDTEKVKNCQLTFKAISCCFCDVALVISKFNCSILMPMHVETITNAFKNGQ